MNVDGRSDDIDQLAQAVAGLCQLQGEFLLRSGQIATTYFDKYLFEAEPAVLRLVAARMSALVPARAEVLAGLELGGVPVATALSLATGIPAAFIRKQAKDYGTANLAEGYEVAGRHVLVIEDVITTGGQVDASTEATWRGGRCRALLHRPQQRRPRSARLGRPANDLPLQGRGSRLSGEQWFGASHSAGDGRLRRWMAA